MTQPSLLSAKFHISSYHLSPRGEARFTSLANFLQEMAYRHANQLGFGYKDLKEKQFFWVLSRLRITVLDYPRWDEEIEVETWHRGMDRLFGLRDFNISNQRGALIGMASTAWLILDSNTGRPIRHSDGLLEERRGPGKVYDQELGKIDLPATMESLNRFWVRDSDLDIMHHVNNVKYLEWCMDEARAHVDQDFLVREMEINYLQEARRGEEILLEGSIEPERGGHFRAMDALHGKEKFRALMKWEVL